MFSHKLKIYNISDAISLGRLGQSPGVGLKVLGGGGGVKIYFSEHGHLAYQIKGNDQ